MTRPEDCYAGNKSHDAHDLLAPGARCPHCSFVAPDRNWCAIHKAAFSDEDRCACGAPPCCPCQCDRRDADHYDEPHYDDSWVGDFNREQRGGA